ncbi:MAG: glycosyltransferase family 4 protein [Burkholderiales bacterium]|nr:glycosyltransferase family 4 protein [Burkholderiales bacterium]
MSDSTRVAHLTSVHQRTDVRIFQKECASLSGHGYDVHLLVGDGHGNQVVKGISVHDIGTVSGRFKRMLVQPWRMWRLARGLRASVYHFHDPELLPVGLLLQWGGAKVVYDTHEDVPRAVLSKYWIRPWLRKLVAWSFECFENFSARRLSAVVAATPHIARRFAELNPQSVDINNYPLQSELESPVNPKGDARTVCYIGGIGRIRGAVEVVRALEAIDVRLILAGPFESASTEAELRALPGWAKVDYRGVVSRAAVREIMAESRAGLLFFHPEPNHVDAQPNKMFEYMSAGLPVLASNFPLWRSLLAESGAGRCADPLKPAEIAGAIDALLAEPDAAKEMGARGRRAVLERYRWTIEEAKLCKLYASLLA